MSKSTGTAGVADEPTTDKGEDDEDDEIPECMEDIIEIMLNGLRDKDTSPRPGKPQRS